MIRIIVSIALIGHGIGHVIGVSAAWTSVKMGFSDHPWSLSSNVNVNTAIGRIFGVVWLAALIAIVAAGMGLLLRMEWWTTWAIIGSIISIVALVIWWRAFPTGSDISALIFNVIILVALLGPWANRVIEIVK
jgi:hypothetical protein